MIAHLCTVVMDSFFVLQIFKLADLTDERRDFTPVMATLQELYGIAEGLSRIILFCLI